MKKNKFFIAILLSILFIGRNSEIQAVDYASRFNQLPNSVKLAIAAAGTGILATGYIMKKYYGDSKIEQYSNAIGKLIPRRGSREYESLKERLKKEYGLLDEVLSLLSYGSNDVADVFIACKNTNIAKYDVYKELVNDYRLIVIGDVQPGSTFLGIADIQRPIQTCLYKEFNPTSIKENSKGLYLWDPKEGIGAYLTKGQNKNGLILTKQLAWMPWKNIDRKYDNLFKGDVAWRLNVAKVTEENAWVSPFNPIFVIRKKDLKLFNVADLTTWEKWFTSKKGRETSIMQRYEESSSDEELSTEESSSE